MSKDELIEKVAEALWVMDGYAAPLTTDKEFNANYTNDAKKILGSIGLLDGSYMLIPGWRDISEAPKNGQCLVLTPEGHDISEYSEAEPDYPDQMGHDTGWWGMLTTADPGRSFGNPEYRREPDCQPTHFIPLSSIPTPEDG